jgi:hypothetical protein
MISHEGEIHGEKQDWEVKFPVLQDRQSRLERKMKMLLVLRV